ncbi:MAG TPA: hypothetical protein VGK53_06750 [Propionicimonas sp.]|jgi:uncharacterized membrane protein
MRNLSIRVVGLVAVAMLAILILAIVSVVEGRYDVLLVGLIGVVGVGLGLTVRQAQAAQAAQLRQVIAKVDQVAVLAKGIARLEETQASSPRMLDGSQERQLAETAARFDWLARRHREQAEHLDGFLAELQATVAGQHQDVVAQLQSPQDRGAAATSDQAGDGQGTVGSPS